MLTILSITTAVRVAWSRFKRMQRPGGADAIFKVSCYGGPLGLPSNGWLHGWFATGEKIMTSGLRAISRLAMPLAAVLLISSGSGRAQSTRSEVIAGTIRKIDTAGRIISISSASDDEPVSYSIADDADFFVNGAKAKLELVKPGHRATLRLDAKSKKVTRVRASDSSAGKAAKATSEGKPQKGMSITPGDPTDPQARNGDYRLVVEPSRRIHAVYEFRVKLEGVDPEETIVYAPYPPNLTGQSIAKATFAPNGRKVSELSPLKRPVLQARLTPSVASSEPGFAMRLECDAALFSRKLVKSREALKPNGTTVETKALRPTLSPTEKNLASGKRGLVETTSPKLLDWIDSRKLARRESEGEIDYARRVFITIVRDYDYEFTNHMNWHLDSICTRQKSDCGGLCLLFVSTLRRSGVPARVLVGRWAKSAEPNERLADGKYFQSHAKAEFFAQGVGWVPVDCALAVVHDKKGDGLRYFGNDQGDFLTLHVDPDFEVDTIHFGTYRFTWFNGGLPFWTYGHGTSGNPKTFENWTVQRLSPSRYKPKLDRFSLQELAP